MILCSHLATAGLIGAGRWLLDLALLLGPNGADAPPAGAGASSATRQFGIGGHGPAFSATQQGGIESLEHGEDRDKKRGLVAPGESNDKMPAVATPPAPRKLLERAIEYDQALYLLVASIALRQMPRTLTSSRRPMTSRPVTSSRRSREHTKRLHVPGD